MIQKFTRRSFSILFPTIPICLAVAGGYAHHAHSQQQQRGRDHEGIEISDYQDAILKTLPLRSISRAWGHLNSAYNLPVFLRAPIYRLWAYLFNADLSECELSLQTYRNLDEFFVRRLRNGARLISQEGLVSPADCRVLTVGRVGSDSGDGDADISDFQEVEKVKGVRYSIDAFLGLASKSSLAPSPSSPSGAEMTHSLKRNPKNHLFHAVLYLAPGDYHRFHAPTSFLIHTLTHISGQLLSVSPFLVNIINNVFVLNERVVLSGQWNLGGSDDEGFFAMAAVGATNVGSIQMSIPGLDHFKTNTKMLDFKHGYFQERCLRTSILTSSDSPVLDTQTLLLMDKGDALETDAAVAVDGPASDLLIGEGISVEKGEEVGRFHMGSTIVLIFEAPRNFRFTVKEGQKLKYGEAIGTVGTTSRAE